jgi:hypothetical protein
MVVLVNLNHLLKCHNDKRQLTTVYFIESGNSNLPLLKDI